MIASTNLRDFWYKFHRSQIYHSWFGGSLVGYYKKTGLYNNAPMKRPSRSFTSPFKRFLSVGVVNMVTTNYYSANTTLGLDLLTAAIESSFNDYGLLPFTQCKQYQFVSGDLAFPVDIDIAVNDCVTLGYAKSEIIVDIIAVTGSTLEEIDPSHYNIVELLERYETIVKYHHVEERMANAVDDHPSATFRTEIQIEATTELTSLNHTITSIPKSATNSRQVLQQLRAR